MNPRDDICAKWFSRRGKRLLRGVLHGLCVVLSDVADNGNSRSPCCRIHLPEFESATKPGRTLSLQ